MGLMHGRWKMEIGPTRILSSRWSAKPPLGRVLWVFIAFLFIVRLSSGPKFIEQAAGIEGLSRGGLGSTTEEVSVFKFPFPGLINCSICLVDTPGIDGSERDFFNIYDMICVWFNKTYRRKDIGLTGLLFLHPISNLQMFTSMKSNYLKRLCQNELNRVVLITTMWGDVDERTGTLLELELRRLCKPLIDEGMSVKRFLNNPSSAFDILQPIVRVASSRQRIIGRALIVGRSLATTAIKSLQRDSTPIIVFIGHYGCGKSQFIDCLTQKTAWANDNLQHADHPIRSVKVRIPNGNGSIILVDTSGFDEYVRTIEDSLEDVYDWLRQNSYKNSKVAGLLILQSIVDGRWAKPPSTPILRKVGDDAITNLVFVTTHWDQIDSDIGMAREMQLRIRWGSLLRSGVRMDRFDKKTATAWRVLDPLL